tara:strand:+ start:36450 stop:36791 length:342 start_codon:yes stop_codon:yes gene_type:complete
MSANNQNQPGLVASHAQFMKGAAEVSQTDAQHCLGLLLPRPLTLLQETIGNVTGNQAWKASGVQDKEQAVDAMKAASANRDANQQGFGGIEEKAGSLVGCEGMQKEGAESKKQ